VNADELFPDSKTRMVCICCSHSKTPRRQNPGEPRIVAISQILTYKGNGKAFQRSACALHICTDCMPLVLSEQKMWQRPEHRALIAAWRERIAHAYAAMLEADQPQVDGGLRK
jgi:hypothetical protein